MPSLSPLSPLLLNTLGTQPEAEREPSPAPRSDAVILIGLNPGGAHEYQALRKQGPVTFVGPGNEKDFVVKDASGTRAHVDLNQPEGVQRFVQHLRLPAARAAALEQTLLAADGMIRDELASLAQLWAPAERGATIPSRLVVSGHGFFGTVVGEDNGSLPLSLLAQLGKALPRAAAQIEDLHIAACNSAGQQTVDTLRSGFPQLQTLWSYAGTAPGSHSGATGHQSLWERSTRGSFDSLSPDKVRTLRLGEQVSFWSLRQGVAANTPAHNLDHTRAAYQQQTSVLTSARSGTLAVEDPSQGPLREHYQRLSELLRHPDLSESERRELEPVRDETLRLLYYRSHIAPRFAATHERALQAGYGALGWPVPDFAHLSRREALAHIADFEARAAQLRPQPVPVARLAPLLRQGLGDLRRAFIPDRWL